MIDKQCFTKIVKSDFEVIGKYIVLPIVVIAILYLVYSSIYIDYSQIGKFINDNIPITSILLTDVGVLTCFGYHFKDPINAPSAVGSVIIVIGFVSGFLMSIHALIVLGAYIPHTINFIFLLITIPLMHGYIKCKKV